MVARRFGPAFAVLGASPTIRAEGLTLDGYVSEVLARSPSLKAQALRRQALHEEARAAGVYPDPGLGVMLDRVPMGVEMPMIRYQLSQMVPWPGKLDPARGAVDRQPSPAGASGAPGARSSTRSPIPPTRRSSSRPSGWAAAPS